MSVVFVMAPLALLLAAAAVAGFVWAARDGQFEDVDTPPHRVLFDDDHEPGSTSADSHETGRDSQNRPGSHG